MSTTVRENNAALQLNSSHSLVSNHQDSLSNSEYLYSLDYSSLSVEQQQDPEKAFQDAIRKEFIVGSAIDPDLFESAIWFHKSLEVDPMGNISTPIHDALGRTYTRFGKKAQQEFYAAFFVNEDESYWHSKLSNPDIDWQATRKALSQKLGRQVAEFEAFELREQFPGLTQYRRYCAPKGVGNKAFLPAIPESVRRKIEERYGVVIPDDVSLWKWVQEHPEIPIIICEGGKKAMALLSLGFVAIALYGCDCGNSPDLEPFLVEGRNVVIAFDQDAKLSTRKRVRNGIKKVGFRCSKAKCVARVAEWNPIEGKGIDDLIVQTGVDAAVKAVEGARLFEVWRKVGRNEAWDLTHEPSLLLNQPELGAIPFPMSGLAGLKSPKGTGKTKGLIPFIQSASFEGRKTLVITHRIQLGKATCKALGIDWIEDVRGSETRGLFGFGLCIDSLHPTSQAAFNPQAWKGAIVILDEVEQIIWHLLNSSTCRKERIRIVNTLRELLQAVSATGGLIIVQDADLSDASIEFIRRLIGDDAPMPWLCVNEWVDPSSAWDVTLFDSTTPADLVKELEETLIAGKKVYISADSQKTASKWGAKNLEKYLAKKFPGIRILRYDSESIADPEHPAFNTIDVINNVILDYDIVIASPTLGTGVSIEQKHFDAVFGIFQGAIPESEARQALARVRDCVPRYIWAASRGLGFIGNQSPYPDELAKGKRQAANDDLKLLAADYGDYEIGKTTQIDPIAFETWAVMGARINDGMPEYRNSLKKSLIEEGHRVTMAEALASDASDQEVEAYAEEMDLIKAEVTEICEEAQQDEAKAVVSAPDLASEKKYEELKKKRAKTEAERLQERKHELGKRYGIAPTADLHIKDATKRFYSKIRLHYMLINQDSKVAEQADLNQVKEMLEEGDGKTLSLQDFKPNAAKVATLTALGILKFIDPSRGEIRASDEDVQGLAATLAAYRKTLKNVLGINFSDDMLEGQPIKALTLLLDLIGYRFDKPTKSREGGKLIRVYTVAKPKDERWEVFAVWDGKALENVSSSDTSEARPGIYITTNNRDVPHPHDQSRRGDVPQGDVPQGDVPQPATNPANPDLPAWVSRGAIVAHEPTGTRFAVASVKRGKESGAYKLVDSNGAKYPLAECAPVQQEVAA